MTIGPPKLGFEPPICQKTDALTNCAKSHVKMLTSIIGEIIPTTQPPPPPSFPDCTVNEGFTQSAEKYLLRESGGPDSHYEDCRYECNHIHPHCRVWLWSSGKCFLYLKDVSKVPTVELVGAVMGERECIMTGAYIF